MIIAFDIKLMRPACVLVAAGMGANSEASMKFDPRTWLLAPTDDMHCYDITDAQLAQLVERVETNHRGGSR